MQRVKSGMELAHPAVRAYAGRHGLSPTAFRSDGRVTLTVDGVYRVQLRTGPGARLVLSAMVLDLASIVPPRVDELLASLARWAAGMLRDHSAGLCVDDASQRLLLQQVVPAGADVLQLERELAEFINALAFWSRTSAQEGGRQQG